MFLNLNLMFRSMRCEDTDSATNSMTSRLSGTVVARDGEERAMPGLHRKLVA